MLLIFSQLSTRPPCALILPRLLHSKHYYTEPPNSITHGHNFMAGNSFVHTHLQNHAVGNCGETMHTRLLSDLYWTRVVINVIFYVIDRTMPQTWKGESKVSFPSRWWHHDDPNLSINSFYQTGFVSGLSFMQTVDSSFKCNILQQDHVCIAWNLYKNSDNLDLVNNCLYFTNII